jgi:hypothetical protein
MTAASADTMSSTASVADQTTAMTATSLTVAKAHHRARARHLHELRLETEARAKARHARSVLIEAAQHAKKARAQRVRHAAEALVQLHHDLVVKADARTHARKAAAATHPHGKIRAAVAHPYATLGGTWLSLRACESHNNYGANTGNGYYGAYQFSTASWHTVGEPGLPSAASPEVQDSAAQALYSRQGWHAWPTCSWKVGLV